MPALRGRVNDLAGVLDPAAAARLEARLADFERETTHQIAVLTVPSLEGEPIEPFALRVAEAWRLGQAGADNGILLVVAPRDRRARIEVGYGLEGVVPDAIAKRVLEDVVFPHFRGGDFAGGIEAGVGALMQAARGEVVKPPARQGAPHADPLAVVFFAALLGAVLASPLRRARPLASIVGGGVGGGLTWLLLASLGWAAAAFAIAFALGLAGPASLGGGGRRRGGPIFVPGGGWGGGGFGGGGGGFGGGGGGFGGGGASGSW